MELRCRISAIKKLQTNALQDLLYLIFEEKDLLNSWKQIVFTFVEAQYSSPYKNNVINVRNYIILHGLSALTIKDMDTTFIVNFLSHNKSVWVINKEKLKWHLSLLQTDRNLDAHSNGNESELELFSFAIRALNNLKQLVDHLINDTKPTSPQRLEFARIYSNRISLLKEEIESDYSVYLEGKTLKHIITLIKKLLNPDLWHQALLLFIPRKKTLSNYKSYELFLKLSDEAGITYSWSALADLYFSDSFMRDYEKAATYLEKKRQFSTLDPIELLNLASIYQNHLCPNKDENDAQELLNLFASTPFGLKRTITTYISDDGYTFWRVL